MKCLYLMPVSVLVLAFALVAAGAMGTAAYIANAICKFVTVHGKKRVSCPKRGLQGKHGKRGERGPAGPQGPAGAQGASGAGSGLTLNFNAKN